MRSPFDASFIGFSTPFALKPSLSDTSLVEPAFGDAISWVTATSFTPDANETYLGYENWMSRAAATTSPVDSNGDAVGIEMTTLSPQSKQNTGATDGGNAHFDIWQSGSAIANNTAAALSVTGVPYSKYDVRILTADNGGFGQVVPADLTVDGKTLTILSGDTYTASADPVEFQDFYTFHGVTASSFTIGTPSTGSANFNQIIIGAQIVERTDAGEFGIYFSDLDLILVGDSYTVFAEKFVLQSFQRFGGVRPASFDMRGVGGTKYSQQYDTQIDGTDLTGSVLLWWEGLSDGAETTNAMTHIASMVADKGDDRWMLILPIPAPTNNTAGYVAAIDALKASITSTYGAAHVYDPRPVIMATDPGGTSVGGLPASAYRDTAHLTDDVTRAVLNDFASQLAAIFD